MHFYELTQLCIYLPRCYLQLQPGLLHPDWPDPPGRDGAVLPEDGEEAVGGEDHRGGHSFLGKEQEEKTEGN